MPIYLIECQNKKCGHQWDHYFPGAEKKKEAICPKCHKIGQRIFTPPNMGFDTKVNPHDLNALTRKTGNMKGTIGNLWDAAAEASEKRGPNDPIKQKALKDYAKLRGGKQYRPAKKQPGTLTIDLANIPIRSKKV